MPRSGLPLQKNPRVLAIWALPIYDPSRGAIDNSWLAKHSQWVSEWAERERERNQKPRDDRPSTSFMNKIGSLKRLQYDEVYLQFFSPRLLNHPCLGKSGQYEMPIFLPASTLRLGRSWGGESRRSGPGEIVEPGLPTDRWVRLELGLLCIRGTRLATLTVWEREWFADLKQNGERCYHHWRAKVNLSLIRRINQKRFSCPPLPY